MMLAGCGQNVYKKGVESLENKDYEAAQENFRKAVEDKKNVADSYRGLGIAYYEQEKYKDALAAFENAVSAGTKETGTICNMMAVCKMQTENYEDAISYYVSSDVSEEVISAIGKETYSKVLCQASAIEKINSDKVLKAQLFNILERLKKIKCDIIQDKAYMSFLNALYYFNTGTTKKYGEIYEVVEDAIIQWCGNEEQDNICFDDSHEGIALYEHIEFEPYLDISGNVKKNDELQRFVTFITVKYENKKTGEIISLDIDYSLYELIYKLAAGYIQTAEDRNNHADFISFIQKMLRTGSADKEIFLVTDDNRKAIIEKTKFGVYKFKVVR